MWNYSRKQKNISAFSIIFSEMTQISRNPSSWKGSISSSYINSWWRHQMETFSALLAICAGISPVPGEFLAQRPVTRSFDVFFDMRLNKRLSKQSWDWWFETLSFPLWRHCNVAEITTEPYLLMNILLVHFDIQSENVLESSYLCCRCC